MPPNSIKPPISNAPVGRISPQRYISQKLPNLIQSVEEKRKKKKTSGERQQNASIWFKIGLYTIALCTDGIQVILNFFVVGAIINRFIDFMTAGLFLAIMYYKDISIAEHWKLYVSVGATLLGEEIPIVDIAPLWTVDAWYIIRTIQKDDVAYNEQMNTTETEELRKKQQQQLRLVQEREHQEESYRFQNYQNKDDNTKPPIGRIAA